MSPLSADRQRKVDEIKAALGKSDQVVHDLFTSLDALEASALKASTGQVSVAWLNTLEGLRNELLHARDRLDKLNTGLRAQGLLRQSLIQGAAGVAAWRFALGSSDINEIRAATARMQHHFANADHTGRQGAISLKQGR